MSCPFRYSIYEWYILLELNNTSTEVSFKAFIITLKGFGFCILECDHSESMAVASGPGPPNLRLSSTSTFHSWLTHTMTYTHIHTNTHDNIYVHANTQKHTPKRTRKEVLKHKQHSSLQILSWLPQTPTSHTDRKWLLQLWFRCDSKLVPLHTH